MQPLFSWRCNIDLREWKEFKGLGQAKIAQIKPTEMVSYVGRVGNALRRNRESVSWPNRKLSFLGVGAWRLRFLCAPASPKPRL